MPVVGGVEHPVMFGGRAGARSNRAASASTGVLKALDANAQQAKAAPVMARRKVSVSAGSGESGASTMPTVPPPVSAVRKLVSATGRGCENILVTEPGSLVGKTCRSLAWVGGTEESKCIVEITRNRHTYRERPVLKIALIAHTARSCPKICTVLTNAEPHGAFQVLHKWNMGGGAEGTCVLPMIMVQRYICILLTGGSGHNHRIARLQLTQEAEGGGRVDDVHPTAEADGGATTASTSPSDDTRSPPLRPYPVFESPVLPRGGSASGASPARTRDLSASYASQPPRAGSRDTTASSAAAADGGAHIHRVPPAYAATGSRQPVATEPTHAVDASYPNLSASRISCTPVGDHSGDHAAPCDRGPMVVDAGAVGAGYPSDPFHSHSHSHLSAHDGWSVSYARTADDADDGGPRGGDTLPSGLGDHSHDEPAPPHMALSPVCTRAAGAPVHAETTIDPHAEPMRQPFSYDLEQHEYCDGPEDPEGRGYNGYERGDAMHGAHDAHAYQRRSSPGSEQQQHHHDPHALYHADHEDEPHAPHMAPPPAPPAPHHPHWEHGAPALPIRPADQHHHHRAPAGMREEEVMVGAPVVAVDMGVGGGGDEGGRDAIGSRGTDGDGQGEMDVAGAHAQHAARGWVPRGEVLQYHQRGGVEHADMRGRGGPHDHEVGYAHDHEDRAQSAHDTTLHVSDLHTDDLTQTSCEQTQVLLGQPAVEENDNGRGARWRQEGCLLSPPTARAGYPSDPPAEAPPRGDGYATGGAAHEHHMPPQQRRAHARMPSDEDHFGWPGACMDSTPPPAPPPPVGYRAHNADPPMPVPRAGGRGVAGPGQEAVEGPQVIAPMTATDGSSVALDPDQDETADVDITRGTFERLLGQQQHHYDAASPSLAPAPRRGSVTSVSVERGADGRLRRSAGASPTPSPSSRDTQHPSGDTSPPTQWDTYGAYACVSAAAADPHAVGALAQTRSPSAATTTAAAGAGVVLGRVEDVPTGHANIHANAITGPAFDRASSVGLSPSPEHAEAGNAGWCVRDTDAAGFGVAAGPGGGDNGWYAPTEEATPQPFIAHCDEVVEGDRGSADRSGCDHSQRGRYPTHTHDGHGPSRYQDHHHHHHHPPVPHHPAPHDETLVIEIPNGGKDEVHHEQYFTAPNADDVARHPPSGHVHDTHHVHTHDTESILVHDQEGDVAAEDAAECPVAMGHPVYRTAAGRDEASRSSHANADPNHTTSSRYGGPVASHHAAGHDHVLGGSPEAGAHCPHASTSEIIAWPSSASRATGCAGGDADAPRRQLTSPAHGAGGAAEASAERCDRDPWVPRVNHNHGFKSPVHAEGDASEPPVPETNGLDTHDATAAGGRARMGDGDVMADLSEYPADLPTRRRLPIHTPPSRGMCGDGSVVELDVDVDVDVDNAGRGSQPHQRPAAAHHQHQHQHPVRKGYDQPNAAAADPREGTANLDASADVDITRLEEALRLRTAGPSTPPQPQHTRGHLPQAHDGGEGEAVGRSDGYALRHVDDVRSRGMGLSGCTHEVDARQQLQQQHDHHRHAIMTDDAASGCGVVLGYPPGLVGYGGAGSSAGSVASAPHSRTVATKLTYPASAAGSEGGQVTPLPPRAAAQQQQQQQQVLGTLHHHHHHQHHAHNAPLPLPQHDGAFMMDALAPPGSSGSRSIASRSSGGGNGLALVPDRPAPRPPTSSLSSRQRAGKASAGRRRGAPRTSPTPPPRTSLLDCIPDMGPADRLLSSAMKTLITSNIGQGEGGGACADDGTGDGFRRRGSGGAPLPARVPKQEAVRAESIWNAPVEDKAARAPTTTGSAMGEEIMDPTIQMLLASSGPPAGDRRASDVDARMASALVPRADRPPHTRAGDPALLTGALTPAGGFAPPSTRGGAGGSANRYSTAVPGRPAPKPPTRATPANQMTSVWSSGSPATLGSSDPARRSPMRPIMGALSYD